MAEAFLALSIAANIAQFVGYGIQLISAGKEAYESIHGAQDEHHELEVIIDDIKSLSNEVKTGSHPFGRPPSSDERAFWQLAGECKPLADKLLDILYDLKISKDARSRRVETVRQTIRGIGKKKDIQDLKRRLLDIDVRLRARMSTVLQKNGHSDILRAISTLERTNERMETTTTTNLDRLKADIIHALDNSKNNTTSRDIGLNDLSQKITAFAEEGKHVDRQQKILESLMFDSMKQRQEKIKEAHKRTLNWIFESHQAKYMDWLKKENGIYWVKGKAGSGKSTLMKYVSDHDTTLEALRLWSGSQKLVTASYFFWNSGLPMQKSQNGLLQSLLYQVLVACPSLILECCSSHPPKEPWSRKELCEALDKISIQSLLPVKFCFFVDGLDEYEGEDEDIINLLQVLSSSPDIKICASSRPWNAFLDALNDSEWKLVLEDLTRDDMHQYVHNMLVESTAFAKVAKQDPRCNALVPQITNKAQGVWLWVYLVVRDLLRDLKGEEEFPFLQRRLDSFPDELEKYFEDILSRIDTIHRAETAKIFLVAVEAVGPLPVLAFKYLSMEQEDPDYSMKAKIIPISVDECHRTFKRWRKLLNSRCRDLLEVSIQNREGGFLSHRVDFLHRTVRDFLRDNYQGELRKRTHDQFDARGSLCKIILALIKVLPKVLPMPEDFRSMLRQLFGLVDELLYYAREIERKSGSSNTALLDELDRVNRVHVTNVKFHWTNTRGPPKPIEIFQEYGKCTYLALAIQARLAIYVDEKLTQNPELLQEKRGRPLLDYALRPKRTTPVLLPYQTQHQDPNIDIQIVSLLLSRGSDPNQKVHIYSGQTVWGLFLLSCYSNTDNVPAHFKRGWYNAFELLIDHGADLGILVANPDDLEVKKIGTTARYKQDVTMQVELSCLTVQDILNKVLSNEDGARLRLRMTEIAQQKETQPSMFWRVLGWT